MNASRVTPPSPSASREALNRKRIIQAAAEIIAAGGASAPAFSRVAERAGLSRRPVHDRFVSRAELCAATWLELCESELLEQLGRLYAAAGLEARPADPVAFHLDLSQFAAPSTGLRAAVELLLAAELDTVTWAATAGFREELARRFAPGIDPVTAARRAMLTGLAFGLLATSVQASAPTDKTESDRVLRTLQTAISPTELPIVAAPHLEPDIDFATGEPLQDALLAAAAAEVGVRGYDAATTSAIVAKAECSEGYLFSKYGSKLELVMDMLDRVFALGLPANNEWMFALARDHGRGIAESVAVREILRPGREFQHRLALERIRLTLHTPALAERAAANIIRAAAAVDGRDPVLGETLSSAARFAWALGEGLILLAALSPTAWQLPVDVYMVPLAELSA